MRGSRRRTRTVVVGGREALFDFRREVFKAGTMDKRVTETTKKDIKRRRGRGGEDTTG